MVDIFTSDALYFQIQRENNVIIRHKNGAVFYALSSAIQAMCIYLDISLAPHSHHFLLERIDLVSTYTATHITNDAARQLVS